MYNRKIPILVFIYNSYKDPLFQNLLLSYIKTLSTKGNYRFDLITFEQEQFTMNADEILLEKKVLNEWNIFWHPRKFHTGNFLLVKKLYDVFITLYTVVNIKIKHRTKYIFAFANVSAAFSILFSKALRLKLVIYSYEPHSEFMLELGHWKKYSIQYIALNKLENLAGKYADHIMTGTKYMVEHLSQNGSKARLYRAPTAVDPEQFKYDHNSRLKIRKELNIENRTVIIYYGKFGGLYYTNEVVEAFKGIYDAIPECYFLIATNHNHDEVNLWFEKLAIQKNSYAIRNFIPISEMSDFLSIADIGICAIPPTPSQKYRSPTKVAEYLLCGLPYITCKGVSEDDDYAIKESVGVVLNEFNKSEVNLNINSIKALLLEDKEQLRKRCRKTGLKYRSKDKIDKLLFDIFK